MEKVKENSVKGQDQVFKRRGIVDSAWELFEKTGNISYYLLYKELTK